MHSFVLFAQDSLELGLRIPLSAMMFLEFAIWGAWYVVLGNYLNALGFGRKDIGRIYSTMPIGAIIAPMFVGAIADEYFAAQHVMAISHLVGGCLLVWLAQIRTPRAFFWVALAYAVVYSPTLSLVNAVVFRNVEDTTQFPELRVLGTIGWIVAGMSLKLLIKRDEPMNNRPLLLAAVLSFVLGGVSFTLPHTPPGAAVREEQYDAQLATLNRQLEEGEIDQQKFDEEQTKAEEGLTAQRIPFVEAITMFQDRTAAVFFSASLVIAMAMAIYFAFAALYLEQGVKVRAENVGPVMTIGQWIEIFFLVSLGWFIRNWGMNAVLLIGIIAWATRFAIFAARPPFAIIAIGIALHGICFDFFFAAGMIHTENMAREMGRADITASAQSLYGVLVYGIGMWLGTEGSGWLNQYFTHESADPATGATVRVTDWGKFWLVPCLGVVAALAVFVFFAWM